MVGGLVLSQAQPRQVSTPRPAAPASAPAFERRQRDQAQPCGAMASVSSRPARCLDEVRTAHARHIKLGLDRSPEHARPLLAACALSGWPGGMELAASIFASLDEPEAFDYNTLMRGSDPAAALRLYVDMMEAEVGPDRYTFPFILKACAQLRAFEEGRQLQGHFVKLGFQSDEHVQNSLISFYGKCGAAALARQAFEQMDAEEKTAASWSALLSAYTRSGLWSECLESFGAMLQEGWRPDESSMVSALSASAHLGAYDVGRSVHGLLLRNAAALNTVMRTSLVDMYAKCGCMEKASAVFDDATGDDRNAWTYSAMVSGLALHGDGRGALRVFEAMVREGRHAPDAAVYVGVLSACSRAGLLDDGLRCFDRMRLEHKVAPNAQHYGCMVDLMARGGRLDEARALIGSMPTTGPTDAAWRSLLNACRIHGDLELAEHALRRLDAAANAGDYVIVADMHARAGKRDAAAAFRTEAVNRGLAQAPGVSAVEVRGEVHRFVSHDASHPRTRDVYEMLHQMEWQLRFEGYRPDTSEVAQDVDEEEKRRAVAAHSQKLAMAFGLLSTPEGAPLRIVTNLRMSRECHAYSAMISEIFGREIVVRDRNRFHRFSRGACSCGNYW